jgi:lipopolysaccharide heptosyltransferase II
VGDSILTLPALEALRQARPEAEITLAVRPWVSELFENSSAVDHIQIYDRSLQHQGWRGRSRFISELSRKRFDMAILFPNSFESAYLAWKADIPVRIGYATDGRSLLLTRRLSIPREILLQHQTRYYLEILRQAGFITALPPVPRVSLEISGAHLQRARQLLSAKGVLEGKLLVGLNPGAFYGTAKRWLPDRYATLADRFVDASGADVLIFGSAGERTMADSIAREMRHPAKIFSGETTLGDLAALLKCCSLFVTNDSGPMHLAAAVGTPTLAIFGPTDEQTTAPLGLHARVVKHPVSCSPCLLRECPLDHRCMTGVSVEDVFRVAADLLSH